MQSKRLAVTSFHPGSFGGGILIGTENGLESRARIPVSVLPREPLEGELWRVTGPIEPFAVRDHKQGGVFVCDHIIAEVALPLAPLGSGIQLWIARNKAIRGVGDAYAARLWDALGSRLYDHLRNREVAPLAAVLDVPKACAIIDAWGLLSEEVSALEALDDLGVSGATAMSAIRLFGREAVTRVRTNPYLLTLLEPWSQVDAVALGAGMHPDDSRRLQAAADVAAAQGFRTSESHLGGHTVVTRTLLLPRLIRLLGPTDQPARASAAIEHAVSTGVLRDIGEGRLQARAPWLMEREIEEAIAKRITRRRQPVAANLIDNILDQIEIEDRIVFDAPQRSAVHTALNSGVLALAGGAGTGKSTICKAIVRAAQAAYPTEPGASQSYMQIAVSGRAAKRLREATGGAAMTLYRYLKFQENMKMRFTKGVLIIDEFSMVGTPDLWRVLTLTPPEVDLVFVGDVAQLPPIKAGYPALAILKSKKIPQVILASIHRQAAKTGLPAIASQMRDGEIPRVPLFDHRDPERDGVYFVPCSEAEVGKKTLEVFANLQGSAFSEGRPALACVHQRDVQLLCMTKAGPAGTKQLSAAIERGWLAEQRPIHNWGLRVGTKILWTQNSYERVPAASVADRIPSQPIDIMNGTLGVVQGAISAPREGASVQFDDQDEPVPIWEADLGRLTLGWAITVHKAQGSAFRRVIIPLVRSRLLDRAMLYTAVTRAKQTAVLVGDPNLFAAVVRATPTSWQRSQALDPDSGIARLLEAK